MTPGKKPPQRALRGPQPFDPTEYPALHEMLPAYLHQDFGEEYGSACDAAKAFVGDASGDEVRNVCEEWAALRKAFDGRPLAKLQEALRALGAAWMPRSEKEIRAVDEILSCRET